MLVMFRYMKGEPNVEFSGEEQGAREDGAHGYLLGA